MNSPIKPPGGSETDGEVHPGKPRQTLRERQKSMTRELLLQGAAEAFAERGYSEVTIDDIAERAGTSRGTFYLYFTKGQVLAELIQRAFFASIGGSPSLALFADLSGAAPYTVESLHEWLKGYVEAWRQHERLVQTWMEGDLLDEEVQAMTQKRIRRATRVLTDLLIERRRQSDQPVDEDRLRATAAIMDIELQYFCYHVIVRGLQIDIDVGVWALAEHWHCAIHRHAEPST